MRQTGTARDFRAHLRRNSVAIALLAIWLLWGCNFVVVKITLPYVGPLLFAYLRTALSFAVLAVTLACVGKFKLPRENLALLLLFGLLQTGGFTGFTYLALVSGGSAKTAFLAFTNPLWSTLCAWYFLSEKFRSGQIVSLVLAFVGVLLMVQFWTIETSLTSSFYALLAGVSLGTSSIVLKKLYAKGETDLFHIVLWQMAVGSVPLLIFALAIESVRIDLSGIFLAGLTYNVLSTVVGWSLWAYVIRRAPAGVSNLNTMAVPMIGLLCGWYVLGERLNITDGLGIACVSLSLAWLGLSPQVKWPRARQSLTETIPVPDQRYGHVARLGMPSGAREGSNETSELHAE